MTLGPLNCGRLLENGTLGTEAPLSFKEHDLLSLGASTQHLSRDQGKFLPLWDASSEEIASEESSWLFFLIIPHCLKMDATGESQTSV